MKKLFVLLFVLLAACSAPKSDVAAPHMDEMSRVLSAPESMPINSMNASDEQKEVAPSAASSNVSEPQNISVDIKNFKFEPAELKIKVGDTVTWTQQDRVMHTATSKSGPESFDSDMLKQGESFSFTFTKPGTYDYICTPHPNMKGKIIVE